MKLENVADLYPLSPTQQGMLFHTISEPGSGVYIDQVAVTLVGDLVESDFASAVEVVCRRHTALRTMFVWDGIDEPLQLVRENVGFPIDFIDWREQPADRQRDQMLEIVEANRRAGFDLQEAPLLKFAVFRLAEDRWTFLLTFHHLILDGWSTHVLLKEILQHCHGTPADISPAFAFRDYISHLQNQNAAAANQYWQHTLEGFEAANSIGPPDPNDPVDDLYHQTNLLLTAESTDRVKQFARDCQVSLNTVTQAAWGLAISRYSGGDDDVVFGTTVAGRPHELHGIESAVGSFINTLPLRLDLSTSQTLAKWLQQIQSRQMAARQWDSSSLVETQKQASLPAGASLFESILVFENYPAAERGQAGLRIEAIEHFERSNYPLALLAVPDKQMELIAVHQASRYPVSFAKRMLEHVAWLFEEFVRSPEQSSSSLFGLPPHHKESLQKFESTSAGPAGSTEFVRVDELIGSFAIADPDKVAAIFEDQKLTYGQLNLKAERVAQEIRSAGLKAGAIVGICVERSFEMLVGILGALKADAAYLPLDTNYPQSHLQYVIDDADVELVLTESRSVGALPAGSFKTLLLDDIDQKTETVATAQSNSQPIASADQLAYVIYTSGSSGQPKGVLVSHANLAYSTAARTEYYAQPTQTFLLLSSFAFDSSVAGIFGTLTCGGTIVLPAPGQEKDVEALADLVKTHQVSHLLCLPSLYRLLLAAGDKGKLESLEVAIVAGEAIGETASEHFERIPNAQLHNEYGPTEATVWATAYRVQPDDRGSEVPIGSAIPGARVRLIGKDQRPVAHGSIGEICVAGPGVAIGYLNQADMTAKQFVEIENYNGVKERVYRTGDAGYFREDGQLMFSGRIDRQAKIRGYRIEPATVEHHLRQLPSITEAVCVVAAGKASQRLVAYVTGEADEEAVVKRALSDKLPSFMVPDLYLYLEEFPRLANGKVDTGGLPKTSESVNAGTIVPPKNETEAKLVAIWQDSIGVEPIGVDQDFFALGGDSIISIQVISRARRAGISLQPKHIAQHPTIAELAAIAVASGAVVPADTEVNDSGEIPLSPIQDWFFAMGMPQPNHWNQSALFELPVRYDAKRLEAALKETIASHRQLGARFRQTAQGWVQTVAAIEKEAILIETEVVDFSDCEDFHQVCLRWQRSLDLAKGPLFRLVVLHDRSQTVADRLLFVAHHLVIDAVSWQILIDDIIQQYEDDASALGAERFTFGQFVKHLKNWSVRLGGSQNELNYWSEVLDSVGQLRLPLSEQKAPITEGFVITESRTLGAELTSTLRGEANEAFSTSPHQLLLSAIALAVTDWTGHSAAAIDLESHGRTGLGGEEIDLSRTVGWMTSICPVILSVENSVATTVKLIKDQLNRSNERNVEFATLRSFGGPDACKLLRDSSPEILFNFLGVQQIEPSCLLRRLSLKPQSCRADSNFRQHLIEINAIIRNGQLNVDFSFSPQQVSAEVAANLADGFLCRLKEVVAACVSADRTFTATDFPEADLSQSELDEFLDGLG